MKKLILMTCLFPLLSYAKNIPIMNAADIQCLQNYGPKGLYVIHNKSKTSEITIYQQRKISSHKKLNFIVDAGCDLNHEKPLGWIKNSNNEFQLFQEQTLRPLPKGSFAVTTHSDSNLIRYYRKKDTNSDEQLLASFEDIKTGNLIAQHTFNRDDLHHQYFNFSADGKKFVLLNMDGDGSLLITDLKSLKNISNISYGSKIATSTQFIDDDLLANFSGTVQTYKDSKLLWSFEHPTITGGDLFVAINQKHIALTDSDGKIFTILNRNGELILDVSSKDPLPNSTDFKFVKLLNDGFVMQDYDNNYRIYNFQSELIRAFQIGANAQLIIPPATNQDFYSLQLSNSNDGKTLSTLAFVQ